MPYMGSHNAMAGPVVHIFYTCLMGKSDLPDDERLQFVLVVI